MLEMWPKEEQRETNKGHYKEKHNKGLEKQYQYWRHQAKWTKSCSTETIIMSF